LFTIKNRKKIIFIFYCKQMAAAAPAQPINPFEPVTQNGNPYIPAQPAVPAQHGRRAKPAKPEKPAAPGTHFILDRANPNLPANYKDTYQLYGFGTPKAEQDAKDEGLEPKLREIAIAQNPGSAFFNGWNGTDIPNVGGHQWDPDQRAHFSPDNIVGNTECQTLRENSFASCHQEIASLKGIPGLPNSHVGADDSCGVDDDVNTLREKHNNFMRCRNSRAIVQNSNCWINNTSTNLFIDPKQTGHLHAIRENEREASLCRQLFNQLPNRNLVDAELRLDARGGVPPHFIPNMEFIINQPGIMADKKKTALENLIKLCTFNGNIPIMRAAYEAIDRINLNKYSKNLKIQATIASATAKVAVAAAGGVAGGAAGGVAGGAAAAAAAVPPPVVPAAAAAVPPPVVPAATGRCNLCGKMGTIGQNCDCQWSNTGIFQGRRKSNKKVKKSKRKSYKRICK